jgi:hypothetical protein
MKYTLQNKLGAWALISLLCLALVPTAGCKAPTVAQVAQDIVNWTPALQSAVATIDASAGMLLPADAVIFSTVTQGIDAGSNLLVNQAKVYLANPSASALGQLQAQVVAFQQQVNASLLAAAKIVDAKSQTLVMNAINGVATIVLAIMALVTSISNKAAIARMAQDSPIKLASLPRQNLDAAIPVVAAHYGESMAQAQAQVLTAHTQLVAMGF